MNWKILLGGLLVVVPLVWLLASGFGHDPRAVPSTLEGRSAPAFHLADLDGDEVALSDFRGRPLVVNFWSTWCVPCIAEHALLHGAAGREGPDGVAFLGILYGDEPERARRYLAREGSAYPTLVDETGSMLVDFGVGGVPETFFIDRSGRVASKVTGPLDARSLAAHLEGIR